LGRAGRRPAISVLTEMALSLDDTPLHMRRIKSVKSG
jgi:hypothetical protein